MFNVTSRVLSAFVLLAFCHCWWSFRLTVRFISAYVQLEGNFYQLVAVVIYDLLHKLLCICYTIVCFYTSICVTVPHDACSQQHLYYMIPMKFSLRLACTWCQMRFWFTVLMKTSVDHWLMCMYVCVCVILCISSIDVLEHDGWVSVSCTIRCLFCWLYCAVNNPCTPQCYKSRPISFPGWISYVLCLFYVTLFSGLLVHICFWVRFSVLSTILSNWAQWNVLEESYFCVKWIVKP